MKKILLFGLVIMVLLSSIGCSKQLTPTPTPIPIVTTTPTLIPISEVALSEKQRDTSPDVSASDSVKLVQGNNEFAFDLYQALKDVEGNLFYSPYSLSLALAMTYAGARGETEQQMADTLHFELQQELLHPAFNALDLELASRGEEAKAEDDKRFRLHIANAIWGQKDYTFLSQFLDVLAENYGAGLRLLDFINSPEPSRITINDWVSDETEGKIKDLIPPGSIDVSTRLVLTNAIYFKAAWLFPFIEEWTSDRAFHLLDGGNVTVPMMTQAHSLKYAAGDAYQAVELPYDGSELSMIILLSNSGQFEFFEDSLDISSLDEIISNLAPNQVNLTMPKFEFGSGYDLVGTLGTMGMPAAFSNEADFSGMTTSDKLKIGRVIHKAFVSVDESGTEATAATAVIMEIGLAPDQHSQRIVMTVDHPFIFLIRDIETGTILFIGRVMNPGE